MKRVEAIHQAAHDRFRPIVMTTISMIAGMLPLALALDPGASQRRALGIVVIGGLSSSLLLTLGCSPGELRAYQAHTAIRASAGSVEKSMARRQSKAVMRDAIRGAVTAMPSPRHIELSPLTSDHWRVGNHGS